MSKCPKDQLWDDLVKAQPVFSGDPSSTITLKRRGLRRLFDMAFDAGVEHQKSKASIFSDPDLFKSFFDLK